MVSPPTVVIWSAQQPSYTLHRHRRRIQTEEKAKVVASVWVKNLFTIPCRASGFALDELNKRINSRMI